MTPYVAIVKARFCTLLQYRGAALAGLFTQVVFGLVRIMVLDAFYRSGSGTKPMDLSQLASYIWLGQAMLAMLPWNSDPEVRQSIRTGGVAYELVRPTDLYWFWYARAVAIRSAPMLLRMLPMFIFAIWGMPLIGLPEWRLSLPSGSAGAAWLLAEFGALAVSAAVTTLVGITLLRTISGEGIVIVIYALVILLSGMVIPLPLFPDWLQPVLVCLPFAGIMDLPFRLYTGNIAATQAGWVLLGQCCWAVALIWLGRRLLGHSLRRMVVQGG